MLNQGDTFGDYRVVRPLGQGGMGAVYLLENNEGGQIAAKILDKASSSDHESRKRFLREAQLALGVKHPNLIETYDVGEDPDTGLCYILMEYVPGGSLADRIEQQGPLPIRDAIRIVYQIASVLELAQQKGIVHRDIKPANIMFAADGTAKLADLGIARRGIAGTETTTVTQTGMMLGTPAYMAPEQMLDAHNVDIRADIYSLGIVFYEMLAGERPNADDTAVKLMAKAVKGEPISDVRTLRPEVSVALAELVSLMCAMNADERIATPAEVTTAISQIENGHGLKLRRKAPKVAVASSRPRLFVGRARLFAAGVFAVFVSAGVGIFFHLGAPRRIPPKTELVTAAPAVQTAVVERVVERPVVKSVVRIDPAAPVADEPVSVSVERTESREVVREVTNEVMRTVIVTNFVTREPEVIAPAEPAKRESSAFPSPSALTNVVEGVAVIGLSSREREIREFARMIVVAADVVREAHGLSADKRVQKRVCAVVLEEGSAKSVFDPETKTLHFGVAKVKFPVGIENMARLCSRFMSTYREGLDDSYNAIVTGYVRMRVLAKLDPVCGARDLKRAMAKSPEVRILKLVDGKGVLAAYFRIRREAYRTGKLSLAMTKHDFAAVLSLACGGSVFPYLRKNGLKVDEFATNVKIRGLQPAEFFGE